MAKAKSHYVCAECGGTSPKWQGQCPQCGAWNTLSEAPLEAAAGARFASIAPTAEVHTLGDIAATELPRESTGLAEFDRVLGGGVVPGSLVLIGGEPGIGKSTLLLQVAHLLGRTHGTVLYVSAEESERQVKMRGERLGIAGGGLFLMAETSLERVLGHVPLPSSAPRGKTMSMPAIRPVTTIEELGALPDDGQRHELLDGVHVVTPSPAIRHQRILLNLVRAIDAALHTRGDFEFLTSPADIRLGPRTLVQPDLFICRVDPSDPPQDWPGMGVPIVAIEILSPGTASRDRGVKRRIYQRAGVAEYWVVDPDARLIERWTPNDLRPEILDEVLEWRLDGELLSAHSRCSRSSPTGTP